MRPVPHVLNMATALATAGICALFDQLGMRDIEERAARPRATWSEREQAWRWRQERTRIILFVMAPMPAFGWGGFYVSADAARRLRRG